MSEAFLNDFYSQTAPAPATASSAPMMATVQPATDAPLAKSDARSHFQDESVSPETLQAVVVALEPMLNSKIAEAVSIAATTMVPDVIEKMLAAQRQGATAIQHPEAPRSVSPAPTAFTQTPQPVTSSPSQSRTLVQPSQHPHPTIDPYFVPSYQTGQLHNPVEKIVGYLSMVVVFGVMGGLMYFTLRMNPQSQTVEQNQQLSSTVTEQSQQILESNKQVLESKQRCGNFSLICNIKE